MEVTAENIRYWKSRLTVHISYTGNCLLGEDEVKKLVCLLDEVATLIEGNTNNLDGEANGK